MVRIWRHVIRLRYDLDRHSVAQPHDMGPRPGCFRWLKRAQNGETGIRPPQISPFRRFHRSRRSILSLFYRPDSVRVVTRKSYFNLLEGDECDEWSLATGSDHLVLCRTLPVILVHTAWTCTVWPRSSVPSALGKTQFEGCTRQLSEDV